MQSNARVFPILVAPRDRPRVAGAALAFRNSQTVAGSTARRLDASIRAALDMSEARWLDAGEADRAKARGSTLATARRLDARHAQPRRFDARHAQAARRLDTCSARRPIARRLDMGRGSMRSTLDGSMVTARRLDGAKRLGVRHAQRSTARSLDGSTRSTLDGSTAPRSTRARPDRIALDGPALDGSALTEGCLHSRLGP